jgi:hypothetical protein
VVVVVMTMTTKVNRMFEFQGFGIPIAMSMMCEMLCAAVLHLIACNAATAAAVSYRAKSGSSTAEAHVRTRRPSY